MAYNGSNSANLAFEFEFKMIKPKRTFKYSSIIKKNHVFVTYLPGLDFNLLVLLVHLQRRGRVLLQEATRAVAILQNRYDPAVHDDEYEHGNTVGLQEDPNRVHEGEAGVPRPIRLVPHLLTNVELALRLVIETSGRGGGVERKLFALISRLALDRKVPRPVRRRRRRRGLHTLVDEELNRRDSNRGHPHNNQTHAFLSLRLDRVVLEWIGHSEEAIDRQRRQREYAPVHAEHLYEVGEGTHERAEHPLPQDRVYERERYAEDCHQEIEDREVHQVYAYVQERGPKPAAHDNNDQHISEYCQQNCRRVEYGQENGGEQAVGKQARSLS